MVRRLQRQLPFLRSVLREADQHVRRERLQHVNADQVNAISELVMNGSHFVRYVKIPNNRLLTRSELPVVRHRRSAGSSFSIRVKCHEGLGKQWCENIPYIHSHCS